MKIRVLSDLHNEFSIFEPPKVEADVVVLAGDIWKGAGGIGWAREQFEDQEIVYVPGNHEYYGRDIKETQALMRIAAEQCGVRLLDDGEAVIDGVRFLGSTLWTDFLLFGQEAKIHAMAAGQQSLTDFRVIHSGRLGHFTPAASIELHEQSMAWLKDQLDAPFKGKTVVVTHHLPSQRSVAERFKDDLLSACFASDLDYLFGKMALWIHGHTHDSFDYTSKGTRVICNPRGYVITRRPVENADFDPALIVEI